MFFILVPNVLLSGSYDKCGNTKVLMLVNVSDKNGNKFNLTRLELAYLKQGAYVLPSLLSTVSSLNLKCC